MESAGSHHNPENIVHMKGSKREIEDKVAKIVKLIQNNGQDEKGKMLEDSDKGPELIELIEDFHKHYQSLYTQYDHLRGEIRRKARGRNEKESFSSPVSDSDHYSSEEIDKDRLINEHSTAENGTEKEIETANLEVAARRHVMVSVATAGKEGLNYKAALCKTQGGESVSKDLTNEYEKPKRAPLNLVKIQEAHGGQASAQIKELEAQLTNLKIELESLHSLKKRYEFQIEKKETEAKQLREKNIQLNAQISELKILSTEKGDEISAVLKRLKDNENNTTSRIKDLMAQVGDLQNEVESLRAQRSKLEGSSRNKASAQVKGLKHQVKVMQQKLDSFRSQKTELETQLDSKTKQVAENLIEVETLKDELAKRATFEKGLLQEKETPSVPKEDVKLEVQSVRNQKQGIEKNINGKCEKTENEMLHARISELEGILTDRGAELSILQKTYVDKENEASNQIMALKEQANRLQQELDSLLSEKSKLEIQNERLKLDSEQSQIQVKNEVLKLTSKIRDQQKILKEREDTIKRLTEEHKPVRHHSLDPPKRRSLDNQALERKVEELAEKFRMKTESHIRLLYQRVLVAEQIHNETKDSYKNLKDGLEKENRELKKKKAMWEGGLGEMKHILLEPGINLLTGLDLVVRKLDEDYGNFLNRISRISNELQLAKSRNAEKNDELRRLKDDVDKLSEQLDHKEGKELLLRGKVGELEAKVNNEGRDKLDSVNQLEKKVVDLEQQIKEKDGILLGLSEEKREAIRHLCVLTDYHRNRYDHLKQAISKMTIGIKRTA